MQKVAPDEEVHVDSMQHGLEGDPFTYMRDNSQPAATPGRFKKDLEDIYEGWNKVTVKATTRISFDQFPLLQRNSWLEFFIRYNTPPPLFSGHGKSFLYCI